MSTNNHRQESIRPDAVYDAEDRLVLGEPTAKTTMPNQEKLNITRSSEELDRIVALVGGIGTVYAASRGYIEAAVLTGTASLFTAHRGWLKPWMRNRYQNSRPAPKDI